MEQKNELDSIERRNANYKPNIWNYSVLQSLTNKYDEEKYGRQVEMLKMEVSCIFEEVKDPLAKLELIDCIGKLALSHYFEKDIYKTLNMMVKNSDNFISCMEENLYLTALYFRILRTYGYEISQDVFLSFTNGMGQFTTSPDVDSKQILQLLEASYHGMESEFLLDQAQVFATTNLMITANNNLICPLHLSVEWFNVKRHIHALEKENKTKSMLLQLSRLNFNISQAQQQKDLKEILRWWKQLDLSETLTFTRNRVVESFLWSVGVASETQHASLRKWLTKVIMFVLIIDDVYDIYGSMEELECFTRAVKRWEYAEVEQLPEAIRRCFCALQDTTYDIDHQIQQEKGWDSVLPYLMKGAELERGDAPSSILCYMREGILHALELESTRLGKNYPDVNSGRDIQGGKDRVVNQSPTSITPNEEINGIAENLSNSDDTADSAPEVSQSGVSFENPKYQSRRTMLNDSEDDGTEGIKRMRGLDDLGMGVMMSSLKRKRSQTAHLHDFLKRKNRRRTLSKVMENTTMVHVPVVSEQLASPTGSSLPGASDSKVSELESNESKKNNSIAVNNNSDSTIVSCENGSTNPSRHASDGSMVKSTQKENEISSQMGLPEGDSFETLFDVPLVVERKRSAGLEKVPIGAGAQSSQSSLVETFSLGNEELNESASTSSGTPDVRSKNQRLDQGTSEWQLKGKRNARSRKMDVNEAYFGGSHPSDGYRFSLKSKPISEIQVDEFPGWSRNVPHTESELSAPQRVLPYRQSRFMVNPKYDSSEFSLRHHNAGPVGPVLYDVFLEVKASCRPQHVPYISLMSKLNGRPIIGHPLTVELLEDGSYDHLISVSQCCSSSSELDVNTGGRISANHPHASPSKTRKPKKNGKNGPLSKKTRKLSSLTGSQKQSEEEKKLVVEKLCGPSLACVPLNVVFSRINADLGPTNRHATASNLG